MNRTVLGLLSVGLIALLFGVVRAAEPAPGLPIRSLAKGALSRIDEPVTNVVRTLAEWQKIWNSHTTRAVSPPALPEVDFSSEMVLVATMGRKTTGGYRIEFDQARKLPDKIMVRIKRFSPPKGAVTMQTLTSPFQFVAIQKSDLRVEFIIRDEVPIVGPPAPGP